MTHDEQAHETVASADQQFERAKWLKDCDFRERDFELRTREVSVKEGELEVKRSEQRRGVVTNSFTLALVAATVAALANVFVAFHNGDEQRILEQSQAEHARVVSAIAGDAKTATDKLRFLLETHLIADETTRKYISSYIDNQEIKNPPNAATATTPPPPTSAARRVAVDSGWLDGGHNQSEVCGSLMNSVKAQYPGSEVKLVSSSEDSRKDFLGHVTYNYHCVFEVE
jgi:hypothetical protein